MDVRLASLPEKMRQRSVRELYLTYVSV